MRVYNMDFCDTQEKTYDVESAEKIGKVITRLRKIKGLTQISLGKLSGTSQMTVQRLESGRATIGLDGLLGIARALEVPLSDIIFEVESGSEEYRKRGSRWEYLLDRINRFSPAQKDWIAKVIEEILAKP